MINNKIELRWNLKRHIRTDLISKHLKNGQILKSNLDMVYSVDINIINNNDKNIIII
jgi:hypothetical protein